MFNAMVKKENQTSEAQVGFKLEKELRDRMRGAAKLKGINLSGFIRLIALDWLREHPDLDVSVIGKPTQQQKSKKKLPHN